MLKFISNSDHYKEVLSRVQSVKRTLWIGTADIKDLYVEEGKDKKPFLALIALLIRRGVEVRLIHAKEPGPNFREDFDKYPVLYDRLERQAGESKYPLSKMLSLAVDGVTSFSVKPLCLIFYLGTAFLVISLAILVYVLVSLFQGNGVQGWASLMLSIWFVGGCMLICMSIIAAYIGRIYTEGKHRPRYNIEQYLK